MHSLQVFCPIFATFPSIPLYFIQTTTMRLKPSFIILLGGLRDEQKEKTMSRKQWMAVMAVLVLILISACEPSPEEDLLRPFPAGYIDSPYVVPAGSALYFLHSTVSTIDMLQGNPSAKPVTAFLPGHQGQDGAY